VYTISVPYYVQRMIRAQLSRFACLAVLGLGTSISFHFALTKKVRMRPCTQRAKVSAAQLPSITLVGAGPGDPELLTIAAMRLINDEANFVIADRLVSPEIISLVKGTCKIANKYPGCQESAQDEIYSWVTEAVLNGKNIIRLKIGDPFIFGRGGEECLEFRKRFGIEAKVIPGVSAVFSSPLLGSIPLTHRGIANQVKAYMRVPEKHVPHSKVLFPGAY
jgi:precorrin-4 methylase